MSFRKNIAPSSPLCQLGLQMSLVLMTVLSAPPAWSLSPAEAAAQGEVPAATVTAEANSALTVELNKYQQMLDNRKLSEADFQKLAKLVEANPTNSKVHLLFGRAYDLLGLSDEAATQYQLADKFGPRDPEAISAILHNLIGKGGGEAANTLLNSAIQRFPDDPKILYMIGKRLKEQRHYVQAGKVMLRAYKSGANVPGLSSDLAELMISQEPGKAIYLAREDLRLDPNYAPGLVALSKALMSVGNYHQAVAPLQKLFEMAPNNGETTQMYLRALYWSGDFKTALLPSLYYLKIEGEFAVAELPAATTVANIFGHLSSETVDNGVKDFYMRCSTEKKLPTPPFHFFLGRIFFREHRYQLAKEELNQYLKADPKAAETLWMLGRIAELSEHDYKTALSYYKLAHAILPYNSRIEGDSLNLEEKLAEGHNDWAWAFREWFYSRFVPAS